ncbi:hypothetical protein [Actinoplanes sp. ATCC 53533]|uniref:hypothetical protein n=1 Tax=Actinoplanes sp. ATCC 53533 TaxID=1288362 RepID=UPI001315250C|nr:hypothetical protein [Actinoplanes sp. ATCC 53533]
MKWRWWIPKLVRQLYNNRLLAAVLEGRMRLDELPSELQDDVRVAIARRVLAERDEKS